MNYQSACKYCPDVVFPVRVDRLDADEDRSTHINTPGGHHVYTLEVDAPASEAAGFHEAGAARRLFGDLGRALDAMRAAANHTT